MNRVVTAVFDGQVLRFDTPLDLEPNTRYRIIIAPEPIPEAPGDAWDVLERLVGTIDAPPDWATEHDHYLYGTPKRGSDDAK